MRNWCGEERMKKKSLPLSQQPSAVVIQFIHPTPAKGKSPHFNQTISPRNPPWTSLGEGGKPSRAELSLQRPAVPDVSYPYCRQGTHGFLNVPFAARPRVQPWKGEVEPAETAAPSPAQQGGISVLAAPKPLQQSCLWTQLPAWARGAPCSPEAPALPGQLLGALANFYSQISFTISRTSTWDNQSHLQKPGCDI